MRVALYLIILGLIVVSCAGNQHEQTSDETDISNDNTISISKADTTLTILEESNDESVANESDQALTVAGESEDVKPEKNEFVPEIDAQQQEDQFKNTVEYHYKRGLVLFKLNNYVEGVKEFDTAIEMDPDRTNSYINRGKGLMELKRYDAACRDFQQAVNLDSRDTTGYLLLASAQYQLGNYKEAVEANTEVIILAPRKAKGYYNRGIAYGLLKEYDKAIADFNQAIAINPEYHEAFYNRGLAYYFMGDEKAACEDWELAKYFGNNKAAGVMDNYCK